MLQADTGCPLEMNVHDVSDIQFSGTETQTEKSSTFEKWQWFAQEQSGAYLSSALSAVMSVVSAASDLSSAAILHFTRPWHPPMCALVLQYFLTAQGPKAQA